MDIKTIKDPTLAKDLEGIQALYKKLGGITFKLMYMYGHAISESEIKNSPEWKELQELFKIKEVMCKYLRRGGWIIEDVGTTDMPEGIWAFVTPPGSTEKLAIIENTARVSEGNLKN